MRKVMFAIIICFSVGCEEKSSDPQIDNSFKTGSYSGAYYYTSQGDVDTGSATIVFNDKTFSVNPITGMHLLPGGGYYNISGDSINFMDTLFRIAIFDLTQVLNGKYKLNVEENRIQFTKESTSKMETKTFDLTKSK